MVASRYAQKPKASSSELKAKLELYKKNKAVAPKAQAAPVVAPVINKRRTIAPTKPRPKALIENSSLEIEKAENVYLQMCYLNAELQHAMKRQEKKAQDTLSRMYVHVSKQMQLVNEIRQQDARDQHLHRVEESIERLEKPYKEFQNQFETLVDALTQLRIALPRALDRFPLDINPQSLLADLNRVKIATQNVPEIDESLIKTTSSIHGSLEWMQETVEILDTKMRQYEIELDAEMSRLVGEFQAKRLI